VKINKFPCHGCDECDVMGEAVDPPSYSPQINAIVSSSYEYIVHLEGITTISR